MFNFKLICVVIFLFNLHQIRSKISDKRLCANENCTEPISLAKTILRYASPDRGVLSFEANADVIVYSKAAGSNMALWGVEINGKRGYAPTTFLRETKIHTKKLSYLIDTELSDQQVPLIKSNDIQETINANKVPDYDVVYGTTIYSEDAIIPTPTESNILPTAIKDNVEEKNILNTDNVEANHEETQPLELKPDKYINEVNKLESIEDIQSNNQEISDEKFIKDNELKKDDTLEDNSVQIDNTSQEDANKESIVENVLQTITNWISDDRTKNDKDDSLQDYAVVDDEEADSEEEEEEEEDDDYEDDLDDNSEEIDASDDSDISTSKMDSENYGQTSDISEKTDSTNALTGETGNELPSNSSSGLVRQENSEDGHKIISEAIPSIGKADSGNIVKTRQLLSEKEMFEDIFTSETSQEVENEKNMIPIQKNKDQEETNSVDSKETVDSEISNTKDDLDVGSLKIPNSVENDEKPVTENLFTEMSGSESLPPLDNNVHVTPNPIETIQSDSVTEAKINTTNDEQGIVNNIPDDSSNKDSLSSLEKQEEIPNTASNESENVEGEKTINHDIVENTERIENTENVPSSDSSPEVIGVEQSLQGEGGDFNNESKEAELEKSSEHSLTVDNEHVNESKNESENVEGEKTINHDIVENTERIENTENVPSSDSSPEVIGVEQSLQGEGNDYNNESKEAELEKSSEHSLTVDNEHVNESKTLEENVEQAAIANAEEINSKLASDLTSSSEDQFDKSSESSQELLKHEKEDVSPQENEENISGIFSGLTNWLGNAQKQNTVETVSKDEVMPDSIKETIGDKNLNEDNQLQNIDNIDTSEKPDYDINKNTIDGDEIPKSNSVETIENHDHGFLSMIEEHNRKISSDESQSSQTEEPFASDGTTEVPVSEIIPEGPAEKELPEEMFGSEGVFENQDLPTGEINNEDDSQTDDNLHIFDVHDNLLSKNSVEYGSCPAGESDCPDDISVVQKQLEMEQVESGYNFSDYLNLLTLLGATGFSVAIFLLGFISIDKNRKEGTLIAKINTLEKALLVASKENTLLTDRVSDIQNETAIENDRISSEEFEQLSGAHQETLMAKSLLEDQIHSLEKELEYSTEVGLELNRILSDVINSQSGSETLFANVEQLQRQLVEQQGTINTINDTLNLKDTENHELQLELEIKNKKVTHLQAELDKMAMNLFKVEEDKEQMQAKLESEILELKDLLEKNKNSSNSTRTKLLDEINSLKTKFSEVRRNLEVKTNEYTILKDNFNQIKTIKNNTEALQSLLNASSMKAELQQLQRDNQGLNEVLRQEQQTKYTLEKQAEIALQEAQSYKAKYDDSDKEKLEAQTKLEVLSNYFKDREGQLQKELSKQESLWVEHQGEATSTVERIKYMQEELQNCKSQNELLKQEIVSQEVELKSQISVLEKKAHESWLVARQAERRLEDAKQEAAQLRNRLTLKERSFIEDKGQNRIQSPLEQNGDLAVSPLHMPVESPASPPLLYGTRDHLTTSPPLPNLPPFLPPPPGVPFMPPPMHGVPGFMPPPPSMYPVDHRPPPLGRMSSPPPPLNSRYSPDSRYSPYDRNSPSPPYDDDYGSSPPHLHRGYSPYNNRDDRRDYKRPPPPPLRSNGRNKGAMSSGSGNSNESLEKINRHHSKV